MNRKVLAAVVGVLVVVVVFGSTATTGARWNDAVSLDGGDLHSGELELFNGNGTDQLSSYPFTALAAGNLAPGDYAQAPLVISNGGTVPLGYRLFGASAVSAPLGDLLTVTVVDVETGSNCPTGSNAADPTGSTATLYDGPLVGAQTGGLRTVPVSATDTLCLRVGLAEAAPQGLAGSSTTVTFEFRAESL